MKAGRLRERITIQREVKKTTSANQKIGEWEDFCTVWAEVKCTSSDVIDGDGFTVHSAVWKFYIRRRDDITAQMRIKWKDRLDASGNRVPRIFILEGPPVDWTNERNGLTLIAKELV